VVALVGDAGVGKSRLVHECVHSHRTQGWRVLESISVSYGKATPYFPVIDLLKRSCHVDDGDDARTIRAKVTGQVLTLDEMLQDTFPALLALLDALPDDSPFLQLDPPQRRQRTLEALKRVLLRESQVQPLLLVFEDLHWIDSETQALLNSLVESLPTAQLLLLVNYRPEYQHGWGSKTYYTQLRLDPLPPVSADELLHALLGGDPSLVPLKQLLIARTEGNPFFLEESVLTLAETGVLVGEAGAYHLAQALPTIQVPATVQAVLAARIDRLPPEEKRLLQTAAVVGTEVPLPLLQAIADIPEDALHRGLAHLQATEFLYETRLFPDQEYTFKHALTHEVAYGGLLQERRRVLHAKIVEVLEWLHADRLAEQVERLAHHAFRGAAWDKVLLYARQAGMRGFDRSAYAQAGAYLDQALEALTRLPETRETMAQHCDLLFVRSAPHSALGECEQQLACSEAAASLAEILGDQSRLVQAISAGANALWQMGDNVRAHTFAQRGFALAEAVGDTVPLVEIGLNLGQILSTMGDYRHATVVLAKPVALLQGDLARALLGRAQYPAVRARAVLTLCLVELGEFHRASAVVEEGMQIAEVLQQPASLLYAHYSASYLLFAQGRFHNAIPRLERSLALWNTSDVAAGYHQCAGALGYAYAMMGRLAEAFPLLEQAVERARRVGRRNETRVLSYLAEAYLHAGQPVAASAAATRMLDLSRERCERGAEAWALQRLGAIHAQCEPPAVKSAETHYHHALTLAEELGMRPLMAHCHLGLGTLYARTGQQEQARTALATAIDLYRAMEMTFWLPEAEATLAQVEGQ
jgi:tetratricopeptide (TPR) repeat protein